jgi:ankyrin repeat protein
MMKKSAWFLMLFFMFTGCNNLTEKDFACNTLKKRGIEFSEQTFMKAVKSNESSTVNLFLDAGMNVDALDKTGRPALMNSKDTKIVELLLKAKANVNKKSKKGYTALHFGGFPKNC